MSGTYHAGEMCIRDRFGTVQRALLGIKGSDLSTDLQMDESWTEELKKKADELGVKEGIYCLLYTSRCV